MTKAAETKAAEEAKAAAEKKARDDKLAALAPTDTQPDQRTLTDTPRLLQAELRRVGCHTGSIDSNWNGVAQKSLDLFNKSAGMKLDVKVASVDALDAVKSKTERVCPLICEHGFKADGERCTKITCRSGYEISDDNTCEKIEVKKPTAKHEEPRAKRGSERAQAISEPSARPHASGQYVCNTGGCRPVAQGCHLGEVSPPGNSRVKITGEVCN